jgi:WD40 repeat protein
MRFCLLVGLTVVALGCGSEMQKGSSPTLAGPPQKEVTEGVSSAEDVSETPPEAKPDFSLEFSTDLVGQAGKVSSIAFSPGSRFLLAGDQREQVTLWDLQEEKIQRSFTIEDPKKPSGNFGVTSVAFSPLGESFAVGSYDGGARIFERETGKELAQFAPLDPLKSVQTVAFSHDGKSLSFAGDDGNVMLHDIASGELAAKLREEPEEQYGITIYSAAFSPDGSMLASGGEQNDIYIWDLESSEKRHVLGGSASTITTVAFSPAEDWVVSGHWRGMILIWNWKSGERVKGLYSHKEHIESVAFAADGSILASASSDGVIKFWDAASMQEIEDQEIELFSPQSIAFSPDGQYFAAATGDKIRLWKVNRK